MRENLTYGLMRGRWKPLSAVARSRCVHRGDRERHQESASALLYFLFFFCYFTARFGEKAWPVPLRLLYPGALYHITARGNERRRPERVSLDSRTGGGALPPSPPCLCPDEQPLSPSSGNQRRQSSPRNPASQRPIHQPFESDAPTRRPSLSRQIQAILIEKESYLLELSRYIHLNPLRAKMKLKLKQYPWSSYQDYIGMRKAPAWLNREAVLKSMDSRPDRAQTAYKNLLKKGFRKE